MGTANADDSGKAVAAGPGEGAADSFDGELYTAQVDHYVLRLYITGVTPQSTRAIANIRLVCEQYLGNRYELEVIDIYQQPELAKSEQIIAAPTLVKKLPPPLRKLIGNLSDLERVLAGLGIKPD